MPAVPGGRPARSAGQRPARVCRGHRPGSRAWSCRTSPPAGPGRPPGRAPADAALSSVLFLRSAVPPCAVAGRAGAGLDAAGGAERPSSRTHGRAAPGNANTPDGAPGTADDPLLTIDEVIAELRVSRAAFYRWRRQGAGPPTVRLPGGGVRVRRSALTAWLRRLEQEDMQ